MDPLKRAVSEGVGNLLRVHYGTPEAQAIARANLNIDVEFQEITPTSWMIRCKPVGEGAHRAIPLGSRYFQVKISEAR